MFACDLVYKPVVAKIQTQNMDTSFCRKRKPKDGKNIVRMSIRQLPSLHVMEYNFSTGNALCARAFDSMCKTNRILIFFIALKRSSQFPIASIVHAELAITMCVPLTLQGINLINSLIDEYSLPVVQAYMKYIQVCFQGPLQLAVT